MGKPAFFGRMAILVRADVPPITSAVPEFHDGAKTSNS
jgi:hypothetical protein